MAWTTSAGLRARPFAGELAAAQLKTAKFVVASLRRSLSRWHPNFALAAPIAALGFLAPLLPSALTASLLLAGGGVLVLLALRSAYQRPSPPVPSHPTAHDTSERETSKQDTSPQVAGASGIAARETAAPLQPCQIAAEWHGQRRAVAGKRTRAEPKDRGWADLMARVNHDLRTPLNAVVGFSELMELELFGPLGDERYQDYAHHIRDSATDLLKSAEDTLALTALIAGGATRRAAASSCDLELLANDAWAFLARKAAARAISLQLTIPADLEVVGEPRALRQVLVNMLSEAIARAGHGECVILTAISEGELIELALSVSEERPRPAPKSGSLAICLARTLLEMQGTSLVEIDGTSHGWRAVTVLDRAVQPDFFLDRFAAQARESMAPLLS